MTDPATEPASEPVALTPEQIAANKKGDTTVKLWVAAILAVIVLCVIGLARNHTSDDPEADRSNTAITACEDSVRNQLRAPSTAKFSDERYTDDDPSWRVTGSVDAENSYGAMIRNIFSCNLTRSGDQMVTTSANVNGR